MATIVCTRSQGVAKEIRYEHKCIFKFSSFKFPNLLSSPSKPTYYRCIEENCAASGKVFPHQPGIFVPARQKLHYHRGDHKVRASYLEKNAEMAKEAQETFRPRFQIYMDHHAKMTLAEKTFAKPYSQRKCFLYGRQTKGLPKFGGLEELSAELDRDPILRRKLTEVDDKISYMGSVRGNNGDVGVIFINPEVQQAATTGATLAIDGTFKTAILKSAQILNMFREVDGVLRYYGYVLMSSRKKSLYKKVFEFLRDELLVLPKRLISDYEHGMRKAGLETWPSIKASGCMFHYRQAIRRAYMKMLKGKPKSLLGIKKHNVIKSLFYKVQFLPPNMMVEGFRMIFARQLEYGLERKFMRMNLCFVNYWLLRVTPKLFSMYEVTDRTDNFNEAMNSKMARHLSKHPNCYIFFNFMRASMMAENQRIRSREKYTQNTCISAEKLQEAWQLLRLGVIDVQEFLGMNFNKK